VRAAVRNGFLGPADEVVWINTGSGLKDVAAATRAAETAGVSTVRAASDGSDLDDALDELTGAR